MKARVLVPVDREAALAAIRVLDAMGDVLRADGHDWPRSLKRSYKEARRELIEAVGYAALTAGLVEVPAVAPHLSDN
jgi:hypothetical protein